jgi:ParB family transcriptional regulator, chromosome partitioning protein
MTGTWLFDDLTNPLALDASENSDGWYTPSYIVEAARQVLGAIDLDPASCEAAQSVVQAATWYSKADDGLLQPWAGRVWCNPPYSAPTKWADKLIGHYHAGDVSAALMLTNSYTETGWWQRLATNGTMLLFAGRLQFWHPEKTSDRNRTGQTLCYLGPHTDQFRAVFGRYGVIR